MMEASSRYNPMQYGISSSNMRQYSSGGDGARHQLSIDNNEEESRTPPYFHSVGKRDPQRDVGVGRGSSSFERIPVFVDNDGQGSDRRQHPGLSSAAPAIPRRPMQADVMAPSVRGGSYSVQQQQLLQSQLHGRSRSAPALRRTRDKQLNPVNRPEPPPDNFYCPSQSQHDGSISPVPEQQQQSFPVDRQLRSPLGNPRMEQGQSQTLSPTASRSGLSLPTEGGRQQANPAASSHQIPLDFELTSPANLQQQDVGSPRSLVAVHRPLDVGSLPRSTENISGQQTTLPRSTHSADLSIITSLVGMAFLAVVSLIVCILALQLLLRLKSSSSASPASSSVLPVSARLIVEEVAMALAAVVVALDLLCVLTVALQCFFVVKLVRYTDRQQRY